LKSDVTPITLPPLREVIARHGLAASKALGQNFLLDEQLLDRIAAIPGNLAGKTVYEVGPGPGGMTRALLRAGASVVVVERDRRCIPALEELAIAFPGKLQIIEDDALKLSIDALLPGGGHIVSNLPYNIGTALLVRWLTQPHWPPLWDSLTLMFQREVAERIVAKPGTEHYGRLSILTQWRSTVRLAMPVHRSAFTPPPKVMSAVIHLEPIAQPPGVDARMLENLTAQAFGQRRKMLRQSLKSMPGALAVLELLGVDQTARPETLPVDTFVQIATHLSKFTAVPLGRQA
jgi:16S rRNA (adenine1518-N6/adenine1519-N6)-dimethyltransferase